MTIDEGKLQDLLSRRKKHIKTSRDVLEAFIALFSYIVSILLSGVLECDLRVKIAVALLGAVYAAMFVFSIYGANYSVETLFNEIVSCSDNHHFSLVVIKNKTNCYLLKWDKRWRTYLFPYERTKENDSEAIVDFVEKSIGFTVQKIVKTIETDVTKYSVSANMTKKYHHSFYLIDVSRCANFEKKAFRINGAKYRWFSIDELKADKNIMDKNSETVKFVEKNF